MSYHEEPDPRTGKAPKHQASASGHNISNTEIVEDWNIPITIDELKSKTEVGDRYDEYYGGKERANKIIVITRFTDESIWRADEKRLNTKDFFDVRESWDMLLGYINYGIYRRL